MSWTEKLEHKKKIRKMAGRMLWADFKNMVFSWKVVLLLLTLWAFFFLPYFRELEDFNSGAMLYFVMWVISAVGAMTETVFNYLPLSGRDIVYYMRCRTNYLTAWCVLVSVVTGILLDAAGADVFFERGLMVLLFLLAVVEWMFIAMLYSYSVPEGAKLWDDCIPTSKKVRIVLYTIYSVVLLFYGMMVWIRVEPDENIGRKLIGYLCAYLVMYIFRADVTRWVRFDGFCREPRRNLYATAGQQNQQTD